VGAVASAALPWAEPAGDPLEQPGLLSYWAHWDGAWYTEIAAAGYVARAPESTAFFPVFPMIMRVGSVLGGGPAAVGQSSSPSSPPPSPLYFLLPDRREVPG
jgi:hypothetical protein